MKQLHDPVTGERVTLMGAKAPCAPETQGINEVYHPYVDAVIYNVARFHNIDETEAERRLVNSDIEMPVIYQDEVFWVE